MWKDEKVVTINTDEIFRNAYKKGFKNRVLKEEGSTAMIKRWFCNRGAGYSYIEEKSMGAALQLVLPETLRKPTRYLKTSHLEE